MTPASTPAADAPDPPELAVPAAVKRNARLARERRALADMPACRQPDTPACRQAHTPPARPDLFGAGP